VEVGWLAPLAFFEWIKAVWISSIVERNPLFWSFQNQVIWRVALSPSQPFARGAPGEKTPVGPEPKKLPARRKNYRLWRRFRSRAMAQERGVADAWGPGHMTSILLPIFLSCPADPPGPGISLPRFNGHTSFRVAAGAGRRP